ncbi:MAG: AMP-binding protein, partial [Hyphomicrobiaceae bacterium]
DTRALWGETTILEGYGATECAPVIAVNLPWASRDGTVGRLVPGIEAALEPVEGIATGGRLRIKGPNVMKGYLFADRPGELIPPKDGWHDTGDIVAIDADGFIAIQGRAKRFAKLGGEMVSLAAVETMAASLWGDANHVALTLADRAKGEQIMLVTDKPQADREALLKHARAQGFPELWVPRTVLVVANIPILASGKVDFVATQELAAKMRPML